MRRLTRNMVIAVACVGILATIGLFRTRPELYAGRPCSEWVREAMNSSNAFHIVCSELRGRAVPHIIREIRARTGSRAYKSIYEVQFRIGLPSRLWLLPEPRQRNGVVGRAAWMLYEMGEPARPAIPALVIALETAELHAWEAQEVMDCLIGMGPVASSALPSLRKMAQAGNFLAVEAGLAVYQIDGSTDTLCEALTAQFGEGEGYVCRALGWFEKDEVVNSVLAQALHAAVAHTNCPPARRSALIALLAESGGSNAPSSTISKLSESEMELRAPSL